MQMQKVTKMVIVGSMALLLSACSNSDTKTEVEKNVSKEISSIAEGMDNAKKNNPGEVSKAECMQGCAMMWKSNDRNAGKTEADMQKDCNALCDAGQGVQNADVSSCEKSTDPLLQGTCYTSVAESKNDATICEKITDEILQGGCYISLAEKNNDKSLCSKVTSSIMKQSCLGGE
jgi:hypothetical protein